MCAPWVVLRIDKSEIVLRFTRLIASVHGLGTASVRDCVTALRAKRRRVLIGCVIETVIRIRLLRFRTVIIDEG